MRLRPLLTMVFEPSHEKTNNLHRRKQRRRSASRLAVTAKLISAFFFPTRIVHFLFYLNPKFQASSSFLCFNRSICVGPVREPYCWFSHKAAHLFNSFTLNSTGSIVLVLTCQKMLFGGLAVTDTT